MDSADGPTLGEPLALSGLNGRWWDWRIERWDGYRLLLVADNDLTYHHAVEVEFFDVT